MTTARELFLATFAQVRENFRQIFMTLFGGGECDLRLENPDAPLDCDIEIHASPRGKRTQRIHLLSSGERALVALSLLFGIFLTKPSPFCLLDEVDAPLDDQNIGRFVRMLNEFKAQDAVHRHHAQPADDHGGGRCGLRRDDAGAGRLIGRQRPAADPAPGLPAAGNDVQTARSRVGAPGGLMLVVMRHGATRAEIDRVVRTIEEMGYEARPMPGAQRTAVGLVGNDGRVDASRIEALPGVAQVIHVTQPYKQVSREWRPENTVVTLAPGVTRRRERGRDHRRALLGRERGADRGGGARGASGRRDGTARRRVQAAQLAVFVPGTRPARPGAAGARAARDRAADRHRGDGRRRRASGRGVRRLHPDRRAQHAELLAAQGRRRARQAGAAQARAWRRRSTTCS